MSYSSVSQEEMREAERDSEERESEMPSKEQRLVRHATDEEWKAKVYRKLYAVLTIMSIVLVGINILQVALLPMMNNLYWVVLFPLVVFVLFMTWALAIVVFNHPAFHTPDANAPAGLKNASRHLRSLLSIRVPLATEQSNSGRWSKSWPKRFARTGVLLTIILNVVLTEFVYLPGFALRDFNQKKWDVSLNVTNPPITPAVVVFQSLNETIHNRAILPTDDEAWQSLCQRNSTDPNLYHTCVANGTQTIRKPTRFGTGAEQLQLRYAVFHPREPFQTLPVYQGMDFFYDFSYNGTAGNNIVTGVAFLDPALASDFPTAYECGINSLILLPTFSFTQVSLRPVTTIDGLNAMGRSDICAIKAFERYTSFELSVLDWGAQPGSGDYSCDITNPPGNTNLCTALFQIVYPMPVSTVYRSRHGKDWITILTEEGGVVGFVTFLTWFFGIFEQV